jgi:hypothetical protein
MTLGQAAEHSNHGYMLRLYAIVLFLGFKFSRCDCGPNL